MSRTVLLALDTAVHRIGWAVAGAEDGWEPLACGSVPGVPKLTSAEQRRGWRARDRWAISGPQFLREAFREIAREVERHGVVGWAWQEHPRHGRNVQNALTVHQAIGMMSVLVWSRWEVAAHPWQPGEWRPMVDIPGNAPRAKAKALAVERAGEFGFDHQGDEDAAEAGCIVRAGWQELEAAVRAQEAATPWRTRGAA